MVLPPAHRVFTVMESKWIRLVLAHPLAPPLMCDFRPASCLAPGIGDSKDAQLPTAHMQQVSCCIPYGKLGRQLFFPRAVLLCTGVSDRRARLSASHRVSSARSSPFSQPAPLPWVLDLLMSLHARRVPRYLFAALSGQCCGRPPLGDPPRTLPPSGVPGAPPVRVHVFSSLHPAAPLSARTRQRLCVLAYPLCPRDLAWAIAYARFLLLRASR